MAPSASSRLLLGALLMTGFVSNASTEDCVTVAKEVDRPFASASDPLTYTITIANPCNPDVSTGLFTDDFPGEVTGCTWTCSATGAGWCDVASGAGDIEQLVSVPIGSSVTIAAECTFAPSPGHECAVNSAEFFTMDPDILTRGEALTCDWGIILFFSDFESGDTSSWSATVP